MNEQISAWVAFGAGVLSFFSPCTLPLVPAYMAYMASLGGQVEESNGRWKTLNRTLFFVLGFTAVFLLMGFSASLLGRFFAENRLFLMRISGFLMVIMGLLMMEIVRLRVFSKYFRLPIPRIQLGWLGALAMGVVFAAGWSPCFGPVLASILMMATGFGDLRTGVLLLGLYALGMAIPFILTAVFTERLSKLWGATEKHSRTWMRIGGGIMVLTGLLMFFNLLAPLGALFKFK